MDKYVDTFTYVFSYLLTPDQISNLNTNYLLFKFRIRTKPKRKAVFLLVVVTNNIHKHVWHVYALSKIMYQNQRCQSYTMPNSFIFSSCEYQFSVLFLLGLSMDITCCASILFRNWTLSITVVFYFTFVICSTNNDYNLHVLFKTNQRRLPQMKEVTNNFPRHV